MKKFIPVVILSSLSLLGLVSLIYSLIKPNLSNLLSQTCAFQKINTRSNLTLVCDGEIRTVKLCGIDPLAMQEKDAKKLITSLIESNETESGMVSVMFVDNLAEVYLPTNEPGIEKMLAEELLVKGLAKFSEKDNCPNNNPLKQAELLAKQAKLGIWK